MTMSEWVDNHLEELKHLQNKVSVENMLRFSELGDEFKQLYNKTLLSFLLEQFVEGDNG